MVELRSVRLSDAARLAEIYSYYVEKTAVSFEYDPPTADEFRDRIRLITKKHPYIVAEQDGVAVGYAYAAPLKVRRAYSYSCEVTIYVDREHRGLGLGRALYRELEGLLSDMGIQNMYACITYPVAEDEYLTTDSARFHEKMGFERVGHFHRCGYKFGRWYDVIWAEKLIGPHA